MAKMTFHCPNCHSTNLGGDGWKDGKKRFQCNDCDYKTVNPITESKQLETKLDKGDIANYNRFVITSAQNDTPVNKKILGALEKYCEHNNAKLLVIPVHYQNPDSFHVGINEDTTWPSEVSPYLLDGDISINKNLNIMGDVKITATAVNPLSGLDTISNTKSAIFGHAQQQMRNVPTPQGKWPKVLHTTGSISYKNYSRTKEGKKGEHYHTPGAVIIEADDEHFWYRQIQFKGNGFYDLDKFYTENEVVEGGVEALVVGDEHVRFMNSDTKDMIFFNKDSICNTLKPKNIVSHDVYDHYSRSHHEDADYISQLIRTNSGDDDVQKELSQVRDHLDDTTPEFSIRYIVSSNHHDHLRQWLNRYKPNSDLKNAAFYHRMMADVIDEIQEGGNRSPFQIYLDSTCRNRLKFVGGKRGLTIKGIECSEHGDVGPNGARGSPGSFANSSHPMIVGHSDSPCIEKSLYRVGVSSPDLPYANRGLSSWSITHAVIYPDGSRSLITMINGKWKL